MRAKVGSRALFVIETKKRVCDGDGTETDVLLSVAKEEDATAEEEEATGQELINLHDARLTCPRAAFSTLGCWAAFVFGSMHRILHRYL